MEINPSQVGGNESFPGVREREFFEVGDDVTSATSVETGAGEDGSVKGDQLVEEEEDEDDEDEGQDSGGYNPRFPCSLTL